MSGALSAGTEMALDDALGIVAHEAAALGEEACRRFTACKERPFPLVMSS